MRYSHLSGYRKPFSSLPRTSFTLAEQVTKGHLRPLKEASAPEMEKRLRWYWCQPSGFCSWHLDETYVKVNGKWAYLYRAVDSRGCTVDFYLSSRRNTKAAYRFMGKLLKNTKRGQIPRLINTDKAPTYGRALALLKGVATG